MLFALYFEPYLQGESRSSSAAQRVFIFKWKWWELNHSALSAVGLFVLSFSAQKQTVGFEQRLDFSLFLQPLPSFHFLLSSTVHMTRCAFGLPRILSQLDSRPSTSSISRGTSPQPITWSSLFWRTNCWRGWVCCKRGCISSTIQTKDSTIPGQNEMLWKRRRCCWKQKPRAASLSFLPGKV